MEGKEEKLREWLSSLSTSYLKTIIYVDFKDYEEYAIELAKEELNSREDREEGDKGISCNEKCKTDLQDRGQGDSQSFYKLLAEIESSKEKESIDDEQIDYTERTNSKNAGYLFSYIGEVVKNLDFGKLKPLDEYLCSMLGLIYQYSETIPSYSIFADIIKSSFEAQPVDFKEEWFKFTAPPFMNYQPNVDDYENSLIDPDTGDVVTKFEVLEKTIIFQIAEYRRTFGSEKIKVDGSNFKDKSDGKYDNSYNVYASKYDESEAGTGNGIEECDESDQFMDEETDNPDEFIPGWANADIVDYLNSAVIALTDFTDVNCDWLTLVDMLEYGRTYSRVED